ncbi:MAG: TonB-dependent receptor [Pyrinomonadaceae bacterium]|nr:TonB-dependent receptor [Pyrinomonadaceae bacterium]
MCVQFLSSGFAIAWFLLSTVAVVTAQQRPLSGTVLDGMGSPLKNAQVEFRSGSSTLAAMTDDQGAFTIADVGKGGLLFVNCSGFAPMMIEIASDSTNTSLHIRLDPAPVIERIFVHTGGETRISAAPGSQISLSQRAIEASGALTIDDVLRQAPGFSLFRRSGSLTANPTSQGVSLRGVGANGASRAIVLLDGIPLNSPFGGWVYWDRLPRISIENVEIFSGPASDLYGSGALGGVINLQSRSGPSSFAEIEASYGNQGTPVLSFDTVQAFSGWQLGAAGQLLRTDGYIVVAEDQRGSVDTPAGTADLVGSLTIARKVGQRGRVFVRPSSFGESRLNGTPLQKNDTRIWSIDTGADWTHQVRGDFSLRMYGSAEVFNQVFSAVAPDRNSESLTNRQRNPSQQFGFAGQWRRTFRGTNAITAGIETRDVRGHSQETTFAGSRPAANVDAGGRQRTLGFFGQGSFQFERRWFLTVGARVDTWHNSRGFSNRIPIGAGTPTLNTFTDRSETAISPRVSLLRTFKQNIAASASFYRAFRAPTLNELYRNFRVGNVVTGANADLRAERLTGGDAGISLQRWSERLTLRGTVFWSQIDDPVANVTLSLTPALITRQRKSLGSTRVRGMEISAEVQLRNHFEVAGEYLLTDSTVKSFPAQVSLEGLRVPQVPKHQLNAQLSYTDQGWTAGLQARFLGEQFDDDQNALPLAGFFTLDAEVSRGLTRKVKIFAAGQNLTGVRYSTGRTPVMTVGPPPLYRVGLRILFQ